MSVLFQPIDVRKYFPVYSKEIYFRINNEFYERKEIKCILQHNQKKVLFCHKNTQNKLEQICRCPSFQLNKGHFANIGVNYKSYFCVNEGLLEIVGSYETKDKIVFSNMPNMELIKKIVKKDHLIAIQKLLDFAPYLNVDEANNIIKGIINV